MHVCMCAERTVQYVLSSTVLSSTVLYCTRSLWTADSADSPTRVAGLACARGLGVACGVRAGSGDEGVWRRREAGLGFEPLSLLLVRGSHSRPRRTIQRSYTRGVIIPSPAIHTLAENYISGGGPKKLTCLDLTCLYVVRFTCTVCSFEPPRTWGVARASRRHMWP